MTALELKPCPFCGKVAHLRDDVCHSTAFFVGCETLGCFGNAQWDETQEEAVSKWNTRAALSADPAPVAGVTVQEAAKVLAEAMSLRMWQYYPIEMPVTKEGLGPATVGVDAVSIEYEVWRATDLSSIGSYKNLPDAITGALRAIAGENGND